MPIDSLLFFGRLYEFSVPGEKEVCLNIVIDLKIPGYDPKYALQFKQDLKNREKEDKKKNTNNHKNESSYLDGGEGEIRTLAPVSQPTPLAGEPLRPTWVLLRMC